MKKKILGIVLSLMLVATMIPMMAFGATALYDLVVRVDGNIGGNVQIEGKENQGMFVEEKNIALDETRTVNIYPATGYEIDSVTVNNTPVTVTGNTLELEMFEKKEVVVKFKQSGSTPITTGGTSFEVMKQTPVASTTSSTGIAYAVLEGATFTLTDTVDPTKTYTAQSGRTGDAIFRGIPDGRYELTETKAPSGYIASEQTVIVEIDKQNAVDGMVISVPPINSNDNREPSKYSDGQCITAFVNIRSDWQNDGIHHWSANDPQDKGTHIDPDNDSLCDICHYNMPPENGTSFKVLKTDDSNTQNPLKGAILMLVENNQGYAKYTATTNDNGIAEFTNIPDGTYTLYEDLAPYGYIKSNDRYTVTINKNNPAAANADPITIEKTPVVAGTVTHTYVDGAKIATFVNTKDNMVKANLPIKKTVIGDGAPANQTFTFELLQCIGEDANAKPLFRVVGELTKSKGEHTWSIEIPSVELDRLDLYIREKQENILGWEYDDTLYMIRMDANSNYDVTYLNFEEPNDPSYDTAEFVNHYDNPYGMDGVYHWPLEDEQDKEKHKDEDSDGHCDVCDYDISDNNGNTTPTNDNSSKDNTDKAAKTGDDANMALWIALMAIAALAGTGTVLYRRKNSVK